MLPKLAIIVPCFNEVEQIPLTIDKLTIVIHEMLAEDLIDPTSYILFVDDGSNDGTFDKITSMNDKTMHIKAIKLSRNFGHQYALLAGLNYCNKKVDVSISIDADLQQDEGVMVQFIKEYLRGNDIVYGVRNNRCSDGFLKKSTAGLFYSLMRSMGVNIIRDHSDYRLLSSKVLNVLDEYGEANLFLRGIIPSIGFRSTTVYHDVRARETGKSKYTIVKMLRLALDGITSFSIMPIRLITLMGVLVLFFCLVMSGYILWAKIAGKSMHGWASTILPIYFIGGLNLFSIGLVGEYIGRIYLEAKERPRYIIDELYNINLDEKE